MRIFKSFFYFCLWKNRNKMRVYIIWTSMRNFSWNLLTFFQKLPSASIFLNCTNLWKFVIIVFNTYNFVYTSAPLTCCAICVRRVSGTRLINFPLTWGDQRTLGAWRRIQFSLCSCKKPSHFGSQRMVCEPFANGAVYVCSPVHIYTHLVREPFASSLRTIWRARVYEAYLNFIKLSNTPTIFRKAIIKFQ